MNTNFYTSSPYLLTVFTLNLGDCTKGQAKFVLLKQLPVESPKIVHAIDPPRGLLAMTTASKVQLVDLSSPNASAGNEGVRIEAGEEDLVRASTISLDLANTPAVEWSQRSEVHGSLSSCRSHTLHRVTSHPNRPPNGA